jgi:hypothetical protein
MGWFGWWPAVALWWPEVEVREEGGGRLVLAARRGGETESVCVSLESLCSNELCYNFIYMEVV